MRALDLFCGAGLSSSGASTAGATIAGGIDMCPVASETFKENFPDAWVINGKIENVRPAALRDKVGDIDLLLASPECTNHTCAKGSAPRSEQSRATALQILRFARTFNPRWVVMENVVHMKPWKRYSELLAAIRGLGYQTKEQVLDASKFGVAQRRRRLFVLCDREAVPPEVKPPTAATTKIVRHILDPATRWKTTPLNRPGRASGTKARASRAIAELGHDKPFLIVYYGTDGCGGWQRIDRPLRTVTTVDRFALVRPSEAGHTMRMLQVPELQRAMGLEETYKLNIGTRRDKIRLLGNGVCPPVMASVIKALAATT